MAGSLGGLALIRYCILLRTDENGSQVCIQEKRYDASTPILGLHQADAMAPLDSASMGVSTFQAYFFYSKPSVCVKETVWT